MLQHMRRLEFSVWSRIKLFFRRILVKLHLAKPYHWSFYELPPLIIANPLCIKNLSNNILSNKGK